MWHVVLCRVFLVAVHFAFIPRLRLLSFEPLGLRPARRIRSDIVSRLPSSLQTFWKDRKLLLNIGCSRSNRKLL